MLISGCSYGVIYSKLESELKEIFAVDQVINISEFGASPDRQIRGTIEWIAQNGKPYMVMLPVSHYNRFDLPISHTTDPLHNMHHKSCWHGIFDETNVDTNLVSLKQLNNYLKLGTVIHCADHTDHDKLFVKLITFQAYLELNKIKHLIFDTGNYYEKLWMDHLSKDDENNSGYTPGMRKRDLVENSPGIYRLFSFCSNVWMYDQLNENEKNNYIPEGDISPLPYPLDDTGKATIHHRKEIVLKLINYLHKEGAVH